MDNGQKNKLTMREAKALSAMEYPDVCKTKYPRPGFGREVFVFADGTRAYLGNESGKLYVRYWQPYSYINTRS